MLAFAALVALASLGAPASATRTLQESQPVLIPTPKPTQISGTASPIIRPSVPILVPDSTPASGNPHECPQDTGYVFWGVSQEGRGQCGKAYLSAEVKGDLIGGLDHGILIGEARTTEVFTLEVDSNNHQNGAILWDCHKNVKALLTSVAGGDTSSATPYLRADVTLTNEAGQTVTGPQVVAEWFASHFGNRPSPSVKVFKVSWKRDENNGIYKGLRMTVRAETDTQVITFATS
ncbi:hypothetical protein KFL_003620140 [Klebsormidium nitens]|uniref:Uncharacterized protein n=1 Tax=Klebsormidium nitens TaxID=105231 RepID=A0A1Y1IAI8_KLENI|nr:hypothetical protein KFL_003620140 [Klebsormidium nitens]|eukprot:GAQ87583.1 hypothetical protein KFL_003620140 [Klebsormidium nitens]